MDETTINFPEIRTFNQGNKKKPLREVFENVISDFKRDGTTGSIELHFFDGGLSKIRINKVF